MEEKTPPPSCHPSSPLPCPDPFLPFGYPPPLHPAGPCASIFNAFLLDYFFLLTIKPTPCVNVEVQSQTIGRAPSVVESQARPTFREMMAAAAVESYLSPGLDSGPAARRQPQMRRRTFDRKSMEFDQIDLPTLSLVQVESKNGPMIPSDFIDLVPQYYILLYFIRLLTKLSQTVYDYCSIYSMMVSQQTRLANKLGNGTDRQITVDGRYSIRLMALPYLVFSSHDRLLSSQDQAHKAQLRNRDAYCFSDLSTCQLQPTVLPRRWLAHAGTCKLV
jgi:hypothetical protein